MLKDLNLHQDNRYVSTNVGLCWETHVALTGMAVDHRLDILHTICSTATTNDRYHSKNWPDAFSVQSYYFLGGNNDRTKRALFLFLLYCSLWRYR